MIKTLDNALRALVAKYQPGGAMTPPEGEPELCILCTVTGYKHDVSGRFPTDSTVFLFGDHEGLVDQLRLLLKTVQGM